MNPTVLHRARRIRELALASLLLGILSGCTDAPPPPSERPLANVILISIDTLRADRLGSYGYPRPTSPALDRFAAAGTLFETTVAQSPWTLPSHASMLSGLLPPSHGVTTADHRLPEDVPHLASILSDAGYRTHALVNSPYLGKKYGLLRGFDRSERLPALPKHGVELTDAAVAWLREQPDDTPFFLFLHYFDVHSAYTPAPRYEEQFTKAYDGPADGSTQQIIQARRGEVELTERDASHLSDLYDAEIRELDEELGRLFEAIRALDLEENTICVITSDHGEEFLEHGGFLHGQTMYREVLSIPLIFRGPGIPEQRDPHLAMQVDIVPTLLGRLGLPADDSIDGLDLLDPEVTRHERVAFSGHDHNTRSPDTLFMVRNPRYKLCYRKGSEERWLYDLQEDPRESRNVLKQNPEVARMLFGRLTSLLEKARSGKAITPRTQEEIDRLKELGYLDGE